MKLQTLFTILSSFAVAPWASAEALPCPAQLTLSADATDTLVKQALGKVDLTGPRARHNRIVVIIKLTVDAPQIPTGSCIYRTRQEIEKGVPNEQIVTILLTGKAEATVSGIQVPPQSLHPQISYDAYSSLNPTFNDLLARQSADLDAQGLGLKGTIGNTFKDLRPALAVRGAGCLMCHARIDANMITDFGYGDPFFFDPGQFGGSAVYFDYYEGDHKSWQTATVSKTLFVPRASVTRKKNAAALNYVDASANSMSIARFLRKPFPGGDSMAQGIKSIMERDSVYIGAPTEKEILELAPQLKNKSSGFAAVTTEGSNVIKPQFQVTNAGAGEYVTNAQPIIDCDGDIVIKGTLFLNGVTFRIQDDGCRLYVAGTVFIQSPPQYITKKNEYSAPAAQITSSSAILMGFNLGTLSKRLGLNGENPHILGLSVTRAGPADKIHPQLYKDAEKIGGGLIDAGDTVYSIKGLLLNAPIVHSRYRGPFSGSIIAEIALLRPGEFKFTFDDNVLVSDFFPLLQRPVLKLSEH